MAEFTETPVASVPPGALLEPTHRATSYLGWESSADYCRTVIEVDNLAGTEPMRAGTVLQDQNGDFAGILYGFPLAAGAVEDRTVTHRGPCIVRNAELRLERLSAQIEFFREHKL